MATVSVGTTADDQLTGIVWPASTADIATMNNLLLDDLTTGHPAAHISGIGGIENVGILYVPNRGQLTIEAGDVVAIDPDTGGVILITALAAAGDDWVVA